MLRKINYYGFDKETYDACAQPIQHSNRQHAEIINWWFLSVNVLYLVCAQFGWLNVDAGNKMLYASYIAVTGVFIAVERFVPRFRQMSLLPTLINIVILVSFGIAVSNAAPYMIAFMFMIIILVIATSYIETMTRMVCILGICTVVFVYYSYVRKPLSISYQDVCNIIIILGLAIALHYPFQRMRIQQFVINNQNVMIHRELEVKSSFDELTSLFNRTTFFAICAASLRQRASFAALCIVDLDGFKQINDQLGHQAGDRAIQIVGEVIMDVLQVDVSDKWEYKEMVTQGGDSFAGRLGGDEFIVLVCDKNGEEEVRALLEDIRKRLNSVEEGEIHGLMASIGMTQISDESDIDSAYRRADTALYRAKDGGKNQICVG